MWKSIQINLVKPFLRRAGSMLAAWMIGKGVDPNLAGQIEVGLLAFGLLCSDYFLSWRDRKDAK